MRSGWGRMKARNSLRVGRRRIAVAEVVLCVGLVWAAWASVPAVESVARPAGSASHGVAGQAGGSVLDGVFTEAQASSGEGHVPAGVRGLPRPGASSPAAGFA